MNMPHIDVLRRRIRAFWLMSTHHDRQHDATKAIGVLPRQLPRASAMPTNIVAFRVTAQSKRRS